MPTFLSGPLHLLLGSWEDLPSKLSSAFQTLHVRPPSALSPLHAPPHFFLVSHVSPYTSPSHGGLPWPPITPASLSFLHKGIFNVFIHLPFHALGYKLHEGDACLIHQCFQVSNKWNHQWVGNAEKTGESENKSKNVHHPHRLEMPSVMLWTQFSSVCFPTQMYIKTGGL